MANFSRYLMDDEKIELETGYGKTRLKITVILMWIFSIIFVWTVIAPILCLLGYIWAKSSHYLITDKRIILISGILTKKVVALPYEKITDTQVVENVIVRMIFKCGDIHLNTAGAGVYEGILKSVENPFELKKVIDKHLK